MGTANKSNVTLRSDKSSPLTREEMDGNFSELENVIDDSLANEQRLDGNDTRIDGIDSRLTDKENELDDPTFGLDRRTIYVGSVAELEALSLAVGTSVYLTQEGRAGEFVVKAGTPPSDPQKGIFIVLSNGNYAERVGASSGRIQARWFGILGDGTDETQKLRDLASYASGSKRGIDFEPNKTYNYSNYVYFNDAGVLDFKGSLVVFEHSGNSTGLQLKGQTGIINSRHQNNGTPSGTLGPAGQRDIVALDAYDTEFRNIRFVSGTNDYAPFNILGDSHGITVENIEFEDGEWDMGCIIHWATVSDSAAVDYSADIAFSPGAGNDTTHPHNIKVNNIKGGVFTPAGGLVSQLFLSGCYDIDAANVLAKEVNRIVTVISGDYGISFAPIEVSRFVGSGINVTNPTCNTITGTEGISISGKGVFTSNVLKMDVTINNPQIRTTAAGTSYGIRVDNVSGVSVYGGRVLGFSRSIFGQRNVKGFTAEGTTLSESQTGSILFDSDEDTNFGISLRGLKIHSNNTTGDTTPASSGIVIRNTDGANISGNFFGLFGETEAQRHSVYIEDGCNNITLSGNHTYASAETAAYNAELVTQYSMLLWDGGGNTSDTAFIFSPVGHAWYRPLGFGNKSAYINSNNAVPDSGTWSAGDEVIFRTPNAGTGHRGALCVTAGTPGAWKRWGQLEA